MGFEILEENEKFLQPLRFAILRHVLPPSSDRASHLDLLLQKSQRADELLLTFETQEEMTGWHLGATARRLADHRPLYLDYEGPISENRGHVQPLVRGTFHWLVQTDILLQAKLVGQPQRKVPGTFHPAEPQRKVPGTFHPAEITGLLELSKVDESGDWILRFTPICEPPKCS